MIVTFEQPNLCAELTRNRILIAPESRVRRIANETRHARNQGRCRMISVIGRMYSKSCEEVSAQKICKAQICWCSSHSQTTPVFNKGCLESSSLDMPSANRYSFDWSANRLHHDLKVSTNVAELVDSSAAALGMDKVSGPTIDLAGHIAPTEQGKELTVIGDGLNIQGLDRNRSQRRT